MNETIRNATDNDRVGLDSLFGQSLQNGYIRQADDLAPIAGNVVLTQGESIKGCVYYSSVEQAWFATLDPTLSAGSVQRLIELAEGQIDSIWIRPCNNKMSKSLIELNWTEDRVIYQMQFHGVPGDQLKVSPFDGNLSELVELNNKAFAGHPDQQNQSEEHFEKLTAHDWFDPNDLLIFRQDRKIAGFCWTRQASASSGEIYLLALHPDLQGKGLGRQLVNAGIHHLRDKAENVYLHVDSKSTKAVASYEAIGFTTTAELRLFSRA